jgi:manganese oxidase
MSGQFLRAAAVLVAVWATPFATSRSYPPKPARHSAKLETVVPNDNRRPAGVMRDGVHHLALSALLGDWHPDGDRAPGVSMPAFAETGHAPNIPGPLLRVRAGTAVQVTIRNTLADTLRVYGLHDRATGVMPSAISQAPRRIAPGALDTVTFRLDAPGTYHYWGTTTGRAIGFRTREDAQLTGAIVVDDAASRRINDRIFVIGAWTDTVARSRVSRNRFLAVINGRSWPSTERLNYATGDTVFWRVINASGDAHPMHLHGFYFRIDARGDGRADTAYAPNARQLAVTETMASGGTMLIRWIPERAGNWLFHCHIPEHFAPRLPLGMPRPSDDGAAHGMHRSEANHATEGMSGLVLGIAVRESGRRVAAVAAQNLPLRRLRLLVRASNASTASNPLFSYTLHEQGPEPRLPAAYRVAPVLDLARGQPVRITVVNRLAEQTAVHWHGIELESFFDGVPGFSGSARQTTPMIAPGDSFEVRFTPPRSGTFIYHTHASEARQQTAGLIGAIVVGEPGIRRDTLTDIPLLLGEGPGPDLRNVPLLVNGTNKPDTMTLRAGTTYRLRLINMTVTLAVVRAELRRDTSLLTWRVVAKDGADLASADRATGPGWFRFGIGEVYDMEVTPDRPGPMRLELRQGLQWPMPAPLLTILPFRVVPE